MPGYAETIRGEGDALVRSLIDEHATRCQHRVEGGTLRQLSADEVRELDLEPREWYTDDDIKNPKMPPLAERPFCDNEALSNVLDEMNQVFKLYSRAGDAGADIIRSDTFDLALLCSELTTADGDSKLRVARRIMLFAEGMRARSEKRGDAEPLQEQISRWAEMIQTAAVAIGIIGSNGITRT